MAMILSVVNSIIEYLASTSFGQFIVKKLDSVLWTLERPAKYCVHGDSKADNRDLPWLLFWTVLIYMQIFRVVFSTILIQFNKSPIEPNDVVIYLQKWRRSLRSIRFKGLRKIRESRVGTDKLNGNSVKGSSPTRKQPSKKRNYEEMLDYNVLEDLLNRTFSDTDDADSTFTISKIEDNSTNASSSQNSHSEDYQSSPRPKNNLHKLLQDTLPVASTSETEIPGPNVSPETTPESTVADTDEFVMTKDGSTSSLNEDSRTKFESNGKLSIGSDANLSSKSEPESNKQHNGVNGNGKWSLNEPLDAADTLMSKLVEKGRAVNNRVYGKYQKNNKKNWKGMSDDKLTGAPNRNSTRSSRENVNRQQPMNPSKSQESIEKRV